MLLKCKESTIKCVVELCSKAKELSSHVFWPNNSSKLCTETLDCTYCHVMLVAGSPWGKKLFLRYGVTILFKKMQVEYRYSSECISNQGIKTMILVRYDTKWSKVLVDCIFCLNCPTTMQQMLSIKYSIAQNTPHKIKLENSIVVITVIWFSVSSIHNHQYHNPLTTWLTSSTHTSSHINSYCQTNSL